jgi:hypothetical protein
VLTRPATACVRALGRPRRHDLRVFNPDDCFWPEPPLLIVFHSAWVVSVIALTAVGSYLLDRAQHVFWLREMDLLRAEGQVRTLLHNVLPPSIAARKAGRARPRSSIGLLKVPRAYRSGSRFCLDDFGYVTNGTIFHCHPRGDGLSGSEPSPGWVHKSAACITLTGTASSLT